MSRKSSNTNSARINKQVLFLGERAESVVVVVPFHIILFVSRSADRTIAVSNTGFGYFDLLLLRGGEGGIGRGDFVRMLF